MYNAKELAILKNRLEHQLKRNSQLDFMKYCYYQLYFRDTLTERKLRNHFDEDIIEKAKESKIIVPWKDGYYFRAYDLCKERFGIPGKEGSPIMEDIDSLKKKIAEKENELGELKIKYSHIVDVGFVML